MQVLESVQCKTKKKKTKKLINAPFQRSAGFFLNVVRGRSA